MASSPHSTASSSATNPFSTAAPTPIPASTLQLVNIRSHVPIELDFTEANYSAFFMLTFRKFGMLDQIDGTVDARQHIYDAEWTQVDSAIVSWPYTTVSREIFNTMLKPNYNTYCVWTAIAGVFLDNSMQRAVYTQQKFRSLYQGDLSMSEYCAHLKQLADTLRDVGAPVTDQYKL
ncbi:uncharacterized protein LOC133884094 [Phragmites australis]|uniref:uncharacterized protein LOC133884094 n=1 Tax=Phragmites australis TaxID=29695 RepID=UPI002D7719FC|nr:uncharacterized protein LOC133884094 [Phragmites australis]